MFLRRFPWFLWGLLLFLAGISIYVLAILLSALRLLLFLPAPAAAWVARLLWISGAPSTIGIMLMALDLALLLPSKRGYPRRLDPAPELVAGLTVALTAYNDEASIGSAVLDFRRHSAVTRVIVVDNNSTDRTAEFAEQAGAIVVTETQPGYGRCVYRCFQEALRFSDARFVVLCEGDRTFRAADLDKFMAYAGHADIVVGTRIVEQLREYATQLSTFMYYANFLGGKLLEVKHLGKGTYTDLGTTYKLVRRDAIERLMSRLDPQVNLEFNAHFMDKALEAGLLMLECPITFHPRVGKSKGGNVDNRRALRVGIRMLLGLVFGWRWLR